MVQKVLISSKACGSKSLISVQNKEYISKDITSKTLNHLLFSFVQFDLLISLISIPLHTNTNTEYI